MERTACIDVGTNTALLLVADLDPGTGRILPVEHLQTIVRLGQGVDRRRLIHPEAIERLVSSMLAYRERCEALGVQRVVAAGTSALRDAANRREVIAEVERRAGIRLRCISGGEEAALTFFGAVAGIEEVPAPFTVIDIGGGSTEIIMGSKSSVEHSVSIDIGSVRLTERFIPSLPPSEAAFEEARQEVNRQLTENLAPFFASRSMVFGVAGTLTTIAQVAMGETAFVAEKVQGYRLTYDDVHRMLEGFRTMGLAEIVALGIPEGRADVILMGTLILHQFMRLLGVGSITVSIQGLRFGLAQEELNRLRNAGLR